MIAMMWMAAVLQAAGPPAPPQVPEILVERRLAEEIPLAVGDTVRARALAGTGAARPFVVAGVFEREADPNRIARNDYEVRLHLPDLEAMLPMRDRVDRFAIVLAPGADADSAARWIEGMAFGTRAYGSAALAEQTSTTFAVVSRFHDAIGIVTMLASAIFLLCVMVIRVDERKRDMGVLRLIGVSRCTVFRAIVVEAIGIAVVGSAAGARAGRAGGEDRQRLLRERLRHHAEVRAGHPAHRPPGRRAGAGAGRGGRRSGGVARGARGPAEAGGAVIVSAFLRSLFRRGGRTALALAGIAVSAALLLDMTMLACGLTGSFGELLGVSGYALRVTPRGTLPFDSEAGIGDGGRGGPADRGGAGRPRRRAGAGRAVLPGPRRQRRRAALHRPASIRQRSSSTASSRAASPARARWPSASRSRGTRGSRSATRVRLAAELDVSLGRARQTRAYRVSGIADFLYDYAGQRSLAMPIGEVQRATGRPGEVSLFGVATDEGVDDDALARRITAAVPEVSTYSTRELMAEMDQRLLYFRQLATILGSIALVVTALLVSTIVTIGVREQLRRDRHAARDRRFARAGAAGDRGGGAGAGGDRCLAGLPLGLWMAARLDRILLSFPGHPGEDDLLRLGARPRAPGDRHRDHRRRARRPAPRLERDPHAAGPRAARGGGVRGEAQSLVPVRHGLKPPRVETRG